MIRILENSEEQAIKILVIEDNKGDLELIMLLLKPLYETFPNLELTSVRTRAEAEKHIQKQYPDAAIVDLGMPDATRQQMLDVIHSYKDKSVVLVLTGASIAEVSDAAIGHGAAAVMNKDDVMAHPKSLALKLAHLLSFRFTWEDRLDKCAETIEKLRQFLREHEHGTPQE